jgi:hypothetical protein
MSHPEIRLWSPGWVWGAKVVEIVVLDGPPPDASPLATVLESDWLTVSRNGWLGEPQLDLLRRDPAPAHPDGSVALAYDVIDEGVSVLAHEVSLETLRRVVGSWALEGNSEARIDVNRNLETASQGDEIAALQHIADRGRLEGSWLSDAIREVAARISAGLELPTGRNQDTTWYSKEHPAQRCRVVLGPGWSGANTLEITLTGPGRIERRSQMLGLFGEWWRSARQGWFDDAVVGPFTPVADVDETSIAWLLDVQGSSVLELEVGVQVLVHMIEWWALRVYGNRALQLHITGNGERHPASADPEIWRMQRLRPSWLDTATL